MRRRVTYSFRSSKMRTKELTTGFSNMGVAADFDKGISGGQDDESQ